MWKIALRQLWKNRKFNGWFFVEIFIVSVLLWYCVDFLYVVVRKNAEPTGLNTEHVYRLNLGVNVNQDFDRNNLDTVEAYMLDPLLQIVQLVHDYPGVEAVAYSYGTTQFSERYMFQSYTVNDSNSYQSAIRYVSEEYPKVFKMDLRQGGFTDWGLRATPQGAILSPDLADSLFHSQDVVGKTFHDYFSPDLKYKVGGVSSSMKFQKYDRYQSFIYVPLNQRYLASSVPAIEVRVRAEADSPQFAEQFIEAMRTKLNIGFFYLFGFMSYDFRSEVANINSGITQYMSVVVGLVLFFMFIVFLGIMGMFWFQVESRQSEIGLRMALGASRRGVLGYIVLESMVIFALAFLPALIVCANLAYWDVTYTFNDAMDYTRSRFWITVFTTALIMIGIISLSVLIPANRASKVHPVEALREE
ncbi:MAG: FtsX-like permease family protein [Petrimonas sp.]|nr:FtsX-like permease family protein [Petrimonas sp.]